MSRANKVKDRLRARRKFYDAEAKNERSAFFANKSKLALPQGQFRVSFLLTPEELGLVGVLQEAIHIPVIETGKPTKEYLQQVRKDLVQRYRDNIQASQTQQLEQFSTTAVESEEVISEVNA